MRIRDLDATYNSVDVDPRPGNYYVSIINGGQLCLAVGPFQVHDEALAKVPAVREWTASRYDDAWFWAFGTCRFEQYDKPGLLNTYILQEEDRI